MSILKPRFLITLPPRDSAARLPALLVPLLVGMAALQLALPGGITLPADGAAARLGNTVAQTDPPLVSAPAILARNPLFSPSGASMAATAPPDPLNGAIIAGVMQRGRVRVAVVQLGNGRIAYLGLGGLVSGWRLVALNPGGARLAKGPREHLEVAYGAHATSPGPKNAQDKPENGQ